MIVFNPFPVMETKHLLLRRMEYGDINDIFQMRNDPKMNEYTDTRPDKDLEETRLYIHKMNNGVDENKWIIWAIEHKQSQKVVGSISIWNIDIEQKRGELGYGIAPGFQNRGLMKEALSCVINYGFNVMKLGALEAYTEENNFKSIKLLEGCRFTEVNRVDEQGYHSDRIYHMVVYRLENIV